MDPGILRSANAFEQSDLSLNSLHMSKDNISHDFSHIIEKVLVTWLLRTFEAFANSVIMGISKITNKKKKPLLL